MALCQIQATNSQIRAICREKLAHGVSYYILLWSIATQIRRPGFNTWFSQGREKGELVMKKPWRYERRNIFLPFPRNFAITMIISTVSNLDNFSRALRISDNWLKPSYTLLISYRTPDTAWSCLVHIVPKCISDPPRWENHKSTVVGENFTVRTSENICKSVSV